MFRTSQSRRRFIAQLLCFSGLWGVACSNKDEGEGAGVGPVGLGPVSQFKHGIIELDMYRVLVLGEKSESGLRLRAVSLNCTHQTCALKVSKDGSKKKLEGFRCPCHGSRFDRAGLVLRGPAKDNLPWFRLSIKGNELILNRNEIVSSDEFLQLPAGNPA